MAYVRKYKKGARKPRRRVATKKASKSFAKRVNAVIHKNVETKDVSYQLTNTDFNGPVSNVADVLRICPNVIQGTSNGQRISDQILGQKINIRGHMYINFVPNATGTSIPTTIPSNCKMMVRAFICSIKKFNSYDDVSATTAWMSQFLKNGNVNQALDGTVRSMYLPVNKDVVTVFKEIKKYVTIPAIYAQTATAAGFSNTAVGFQGSYKFFNISLKCKKLLKYDSSSFSPQNYAPIMVISYAKLDDTSPDIITARLTASYVSTLFYEDA